MPIIGVGGIKGGEEAAAKIKAGARLVQLYTGFIYRWNWSAKRPGDRRLITVTPIHILPTWLNGIRQKRIILSLPHQPVLSQEQ